MKSIRSFCMSGMLLGACVFSAPLLAQGESHKDQKAQVKAEKKAAKVVHKTTTRHVVATGRVLCSDGVWVTRTSNACANRGGIAAWQGAHAASAHASAVAHEHAAEHSAVQHSPYANHTSSGAIARCVDGTYWHASTRTSACNGHGGVAHWY